LALAVELGEGQGTMTSPFSKVPILSPSPLFYIRSHQNTFEDRKIQNPAYRTQFSGLQPSTCIAYGSRFEIASASAVAVQLHSIANLQCSHNDLLYGDTRRRSKVVQWSLPAGRFCLREKQRAGNRSAGRLT